MAIKKGDFVEINYTGRIDDSGKAVFDTTDINVAKKEEIFSPKTKYGPVIIVVGEGQVLPGIDKELVGKEKGAYTLHISDVDAFGKKDAKLLKLLSMKIFVKEGIKPYPGLQVTIDNKIGFVRSVSGGRIIVDFNHPLSSKDLIYDVEVLRVVTDKKEQVQAFFTSMSMPVEKIVVSENNVTISTKKLLPEVLSKALAQDIKRLIHVTNVSFVAGKTEKTKEEKATNTTTIKTTNAEKEEQKEQKTTTTNKTITTENQEKKND